MSSKKVADSAITFEDRLIRAFEGLNLKQIAEKLGVKYTSLWNWVKGRTTFPLDKLAEVGSMTGHSLNWLLTGEGDPLTVDTRRFSDEELAEKVNQLDWGLFTIEIFVFELSRLNELFRTMLTADSYRRVRHVFETREEILKSWDEHDNYLKDKLIRTRQWEAEIQELGTVDEQFDIAAAVEKYDNAGTVLALWYTYDHEPVPEISAIAFEGWNKMSLEEKVKLIRYIRESQKEEEEFEEAARNAPKNTKHS
jgi:transcriptional regulator with XRE-family HTH domain